MCFGRVELLTKWTERKIMDRIGSEVSQIREQALIAVQKMMIHNWDNVKA